MDMYILCYYRSSEQTGHRLPKVILKQRVIIISNNYNTSMNNEDS